MNYIIGKIVFINNNYVIVENSFTGYLIYISNFKDYEINKYKKIFISEKNLIQNNYLNKELYGFTSFKEKIFFENLLKLNGIGPKIGMQILSFGIDNVKKWIATKDFDNFKNVKGLSSRIINLIFNEIKIKTESNIPKNENIDNAIEALKSLGYSKDQIKKSLEFIEKDQLNFNSENDISSLIASLIKNINEHQTT